MKFFNSGKIRTKFLVPILLLQLVALGALGFIGYRFSSNMLRSQAEQKFKAIIGEVYANIETDLSDRLAKMRQLTGDPIFIKFAAASHYKSNAEVEIFNFQKGNGLALGEPQVGGIVNFPVGLLANEGNRSVAEMGLFPSVEYVGLDGFVKLHVYLGGSNDTDFESADRSKLDRHGQTWFETAKKGEAYVGIPQKMKLFLRTYTPITFDSREVAVEKELIPVAMPHRAGNVSKGVFLITTTPDFITKALHDIDKGLLMLIVKGGDVITEVGDKNIMPETTRDFLERAQQISTDSIEDFDRYLIMREAIPTAGWSILMVGDKGAIYSSVYQLRNKIVLIMFTSLLIMAAFVFVIIKKLLAPVFHLTDASDRIAGGELGVVIPKESDDEIGRLTDSFNQMSTKTKEMHDRLARISFIRRQLLNIISHELRTPVNSVVGFYDLLQDDVSRCAPSSEEFGEIFEGLGGSIERCRALVERLTRVSSAMAGQIRSEDEMVLPSDLGETIRATCEGVSLHAKKRDIVIHYPDIISAHVACPPAALHLIIEEALSNAIKYSPDGEKVYITVETTDGYARIAVRDRGPGISKEYLEDVVEPFFEIQNADYHSTGRFESGAGGLGLGLTIIMSVLKHYHGKLQIDSASDGGTILTMTLPIAKAP